MPSRRGLRFTSRMPGTARQHNLLSPVTSLLPVLKKNGVDVEVIVKALAGKSLNDLVKDALGVNIHLNLNHLSKCDIQNAIVPLVNKLLKSKKINIQLPKIDWGALASHGTVSTVKSGARTWQGYYNRKHVTANQGETLIAVLRYVASLLTKNISGLKCPFWAVSTRSGLQVHHQRGT